MKLTYLLAPDVPRGVRDRGYEYFLHRKVRILEAKSGEITAEVRGQGGDYEVHLNFDETGFDSSCDCPYSYEGGLCKHVWATLLHAEAANMLMAEPIRQQSPARRPDWQARLEDIELQRTGQMPRSEWPARRQIVYEIDVQSSVAYGGLAISMYMRDRNAKDTDWNQRKELRLNGDDLAMLPDLTDREILGRLAGATEYYSFAANLSPRLRLRWPLTSQIVPLLGRSGRCVVIDRNERGTYPMTWSEGKPWQFELQVEIQEGQVSVDGAFFRREERIDVRDATLVSRGVLFREGVVPNWRRTQRWSGSRISGREGLSPPRSDADALLGHLLQSPATPPLQLPESLKFEVVSPVPKRVLHVLASRDNSRELRVDPLFDYDGERIHGGAPATPKFDSERRILFRRNVEFEREAIRELEETGVKKASRFGESWKLPPKMLPAAARKLLAAGWQVEAEGKLFRTPRSSRMEVASRMDWFELQGAVEYEGVSASLPDILAAIRRGEHIVRLGDGSYGLLPEEWLTRFGRLADFGDTSQEEVRFGRNQALLLDALLAAQPDIEVDEEFTRARQQSPGSRVFGRRTSPGLFGHPSRLPARRTWMDAFPGRFRIRRLSGGRYGRREDGSGAGAARRAAAGSGAEGSGACRGACDR